MSDIVWLPPFRLPDRFPCGCEDLITHSKLHAGCRDSTCSAWFLNCTIQCDTNWEHEQASNPSDWRFLHYKGLKFYYLERVVKVDRPDLGVGEIVQYTRRTNGVYYACRFQANFCYGWGREFESVDVKQLAL